jgi:hypothetical protein
MSGDLHCFRCCSGCLMGHGKAVWGGRGGGWWHTATWTMGAGGTQAGSPGRVWAYLLVVEQDAVEQPVHPVVDIVCTRIRKISARHRSGSLHITDAPSASPSSAVRRAMMFAASVKAPDTRKRPGSAITLTPSLTLFEKYASKAADARSSGWRAWSPVDSPSCHTHPGGMHSECCRARSPA